MRRCLRNDRNLSVGEAHAGVGPERAADTVSRPGMFHVSQTDGHASRVLLVREMTESEFETHIDDPMRCHVCGQGLLVIEWDYDGKPMTHDGGRPRVLWCNGCRVSWNAQRELAYPPLK